MYAMSVDVGSSSVRNMHIAKIRGDENVVNF
jgi:hypothetical protein